MQQQLETIVDAIEQQLEESMIENPSIEICFNGYYETFKADIIDKNSAEFLSLAETTALYSKEDILAFEIISSESESPK